MVGTKERSHPGVTVWGCYGVGAVLSVLLCLAPVWIKTALHEYHNYDLGIFAQALHRIGIGNLNPFIPALNIPLFSDHFDPILVLVAPLTRVLEPAYAALAVEHLLILLTPLPLILAFRKDPEQTPFLCFTIFYLLFNRGILSAIAFPVHPTTWAGFFVVWMGVSVKRQQWGALVLSSLLLMACKEEFPFVVLVLSGYLAWKRHHKVAVTVGLLAAIWLLFVFGVRPMMLENTHDYASRILTPLFSNPLAMLWARVCNLGEAKNLFRALLPLIPLAYGCIQHKQPVDGGMLLMAAPLLAIRFIDESWGFHYLAPVMPLLLLAFAGDKRARLPWKIAALGIVITMLAGMGPIRRAVAVYGDIAELHGSRRAAIENARTWLLDNPGGKALVHGNLTPLLARRGDVFQLGGVQPGQPYRYYLVEKPPSGDPWPLSHADVEKAIAAWRGNATLTILRDDRHLFFAELKTTE